MMLSPLEFYLLVQALLLLGGVAAVLFVLQQFHRARVVVLEERCVEAVECLDTARLGLEAASSGGGAQAQALEAQVAELTAALAQRDELLAEQVDGSDREEQLKQLVQQFTRDSREMLECIRKLEHENAELKAQLTGD